MALQYDEKKEESQHHDDDEVPTDPNPSALLQFPYGHDPHGDKFFPDGGEQHPPPPSAAPHNGGAMGGNADVDAIDDGMRAALRDEPELTAALGISPSMLANATATSGGDDVGGDRDDPKRRGQKKQQVQGHSRNESMFTQPPGDVSALQEEEADGGHRGGGAAAPGAAAAAASAPAADPSPDPRADEVDLSVLRGMRMRLTPEEKMRMVAREEDMEDLTALAEIVPGLISTHEAMKRKTSAEAGGGGDNGNEGGAADDAENNDQNRREESWKLREIEKQQTPTPSPAKAVGAEAGGDGGGAARSPTGEGEGGAGVVTAAGGGGGEATPLEGGQAVTSHDTNTSSSGSTATSDVLDEVVNSASPAAAAAAAAAANAVAAKNPGDDSGDDSSSVTTVSHHAKQESSGRGSGPPKGSEPPMKSLPAAAALGERKLADDDSSSTLSSQRTYSSGESDIKFADLGDEDLSPTERQTAAKLQEKRAGTAASEKPFIGTGDAGAEQSRQQASKREVESRPSHAKESFTKQHADQQQKRAHNTSAVSKTEEVAAPPPPPTAQTGIPQTMPMYLPTFKPATGCTNASDFIVRCFVARLRSGITVVKHGRSRWCKSRLRILHIHPDGRSLSWKPALGEPTSRNRPPKLDLSTCTEVRHAWSPDPLHPLFTGTPILRQKCEAANAHKSFALIFPKRTVDVTAVTADQCKVLMEGFSALCFRLQVANLAGRQKDGAADSKGSEKEGSEKGKSSEARTASDSSSPTNNGASGMRRSKFQ